jgi:hypothetical protein
MTDFFGCCFLDIFFGCWFWAGVTAHLESLIRFFDEAGVLVVGAKETRSRL